MDGHEASSAVVWDGNAPTRFEASIPQAALDATAGWDGLPPRRFVIETPESALSDLKSRLRQARWPDKPPSSTWEFGTSLEYLQQLAAYWRDHYDWRRHESFLNGFAHFKVGMGGTDLHFIHERGEGASPVPLLLMHGWPGSFYEFHKLIPLLTRPSDFGGDKNDAFTVVVPSLPGHGFSFAPYQQRLGIQEIADVLASLMKDVLGYTGFAAHGHDWGTFLATRLGYAFADALIGIHVTLLAIPRDYTQSKTPSEQEETYYRQLRHWLQEETGYSAIMGTKPQTLAYALTDSPIGLAAWMIEKFRSWSDCNGDVEAHFGRDVLLSNVMIYWLTGSINASCWPYYARMHGPGIIPHGDSVTVPTGYCEYPREILTPPPSLATKTYSNIQRWTRMARGGHFPALEGPDALVEEIRSFFRPLRRATFAKRELPWT